MVLDYGTDPDANGNYPNEEIHNYYAALFEHVFDYYSKVMTKVPGDSFGNTIPPFSSTWCSWVTVPTKYYTTSTDADMLVLLELKENTGYAGAAAACLYDTAGNDRPYLCHITIDVTGFSKTPIDRIQDHYLLAHEVGHCLGFSSFAYQFYPNNQNNEMVTSRSVTMNNTNYTAYFFESPNLVSAIQTHADDTSITGVQIETQGSGGSAGSHFEKLHYNNEVMVAQLTGYQSSSIFWLSLLKDMGWYEVDLGFAEPFAWGQDEGAAFYDNSSCNTNFDEFCSVQWQVNCNQNFQSKTYCTATSFSDGCMINENWDNYNCLSTNAAEFWETAPSEQIGANSRCFETSTNGNNSGGCYISECIYDASNNFVRIDFNFGGSVHSCNPGDINVVVSGTTLTCPDADKFCASFGCKSNDDCSGNGRCMANGQCRCHSFFSGDKCDVKEPCPSSLTESMCNDVCPHTDPNDCEASSPPPPPTDDNASNLTGLVDKSIGLKNGCIMGWCSKCQQKLINGETTRCNRKDTYKFICLPYVLNDDDSEPHPEPTKQPKLRKCIRNACDNCASGNFGTDCLTENFYLYICDHLYFWDPNWTPPNISLSLLLHNTQLENDATSCSACLEANKGDSEKLKSCHDKCQHFIDDVNKALESDQSESFEEDSSQSSESGEDEPAVGANGSNHPDVQPVIDSYGI